MAQPSKNKKYLIFYGVIFLSIISILLIIVLASDVYSSFVEDEYIDADTYQAVFLANDQIYFGRFSNIDSQFILLSDVYYVRLGDATSVGEMVRLGDTEPHGPQNEMIINRDFILFWENLDPSSPVIQKINSLKLL